MPKRSSTGRRDLNQLAKSIVDQATEEGQEKEPSAGRRKAGSSKGGAKGGKSRMDALTPDERKALAEKAAAARWQKPAPTSTVGAGPQAKRSAKQR